MEKIVCYYRTSTTTNEKGDSRVRQKESCKSFSKTNKLKIISEFYEVISGTVPVNEREVFLEMLDFAAEKGITKILVSDWSRFARSLLSQESSLYYLRSKGFEVISVDTGINEDNEYDTLVRNLFSSFYQFEKDSLVRKLRVARERVKKEKGKCEGRKGIKETNPELVNLVKKLRRKNPKTKRVRSYRKISEILFEKGFKNSKGDRFAEKVVMTMCK